MTAEGALWACPACCCRSFGYPPPEVRTYPWGPDHPPPAPGVEVCGLCRLALWQGERGQAIRLEAEDTTEHEPGAYLACSECIARHRPAVHARLVRLGILNPAVPVETLGGKMLL